MILWGPAGVGKTSLIRPFSSQYIPTIGLEFALCKHSIANRAITCNIWDTSGQERFRSVSASYPAGAQGALLVYDVSRRDTFTQLPGMLELLRVKMRGKVTLVGNKVDLPREVDTVEGKEFAGELMRVRGAEANLSREA